MHVSGCAACATSSEILLIISSSLLLTCLCSPQGTTFNIRFFPFLHLGSICLALKKIDKLCEGHFILSLLI